MKENRWRGRKRQHNGKRSIEKIVEHAEIGEKPKEGRSRMGLSGKHHGSEQPKIAASRSSISSFALTTHSFLCLALRALRCAHVFTHSRACGKVSDSMLGHKTVLNHSGMGRGCRGPTGNQQYIILFTHFHHDCLHI